MAKLSDKIVQGVVLISDMRSPAKAGFIQAFAGTVVPDGWALCDGSALNRLAYGSLFANIGTTWGIGDGSSTFNLPDFTTANRYLRAADGSTLNVGDLLAEDTKLNGIGLSAGSASGTFASASHTHSAGTYRAHITIQASGEISMQFVGDSFTKNYHALTGGTSGSTSGTANDKTVISGTSSTPSASSSVSYTPQTLTGDGDETRPITACVNYIIKLYDDTLTISAYIPSATSSEEGIISLSSDFVATSTTHGLVGGSNGVANNGTNTYVGGSGEIGEAIYAEVLETSSVSATSNVWTTITSITIDEGKWSISACGHYECTANTMSQFSTGISLATGTAPSYSYIGRPNVATGEFHANAWLNTTADGTPNYTQPLASYTIDNTTSRTLWLRGKVYAATGTITMNGFIQATRIG